MEVEEMSPNSEIDPKQRFTRSWDAFAQELKRAVSGVDHILLMAVPEEGIERVQNTSLSYLSFDRPDDSDKFDRYGEWYVDCALERPEFSFIDAQVVGLDHNRVLYVRIEMTETRKGESQHSLSFDPNWRMPTPLALGMHIDNGDWTPHNTARFVDEY